MFILVDNTTNEITFASLTVITPVEGYTVYEITNKTIDDIIDEFGAIAFLYDGSNFIEKPAPEPPAPEVPSSVSPRQARLALLELQLLDNVEAAIVSGPQEWQIEWEYATHITRDSALVQGMAPALGLTEADLDTLFALAASK